MHTVLPPGTVNHSIVVSALTRFSSHRLSTRWRHRNALPPSTRRRAQTLSQSEVEATSEPSCSRSIPPCRPRLPQGLRLPSPSVLVIDLSVSDILVQPTVEAARAGGRGGVS